MNERSVWLSRLKTISKVAKGSHFDRLLYSPYHYIMGLFFAKLIFPFYQKSRVFQRKTFFGVNMSLALPAGLDIFILGAKSHNSEIRLAKYMMQHLQPQQIYFDIGAHFGYFSLLASCLVGKEGKVVGFEASQSTYPYYEKNVRDFQNILQNHKAVGQSEGKVVFYEFPILYSEYNSLEKEQYNDAEWAKNVGAKEVSIEGISLDIFCKKSGQIPDMIKIDVEGGEFHVLSGAEEILEKYKPTIIMEYIPAQSGHIEESVHFKALQWLLHKGFEACLIDDEGQIHKTDFTIALLEKMDSENIVFIHVDKLN